jgi:hypothetical protein
LGEGCRSTCFLHSPSPSHWSGCPFKDSVQAFLQYILSHAKDVILGFAVYILLLCALDEACFIAVIHTKKRKAPGKSGWN